MQQRYWLIELLAYWEGKLNTTHLIDTYSITRQSASKIINRYISDYPNNLEYDQSLKAYTPSASFLPAFITRDANEYLAYLTQKNEAVIDHGLSSLAEHSEVLQLPKRRVEPKILRNLVLAAKTQSRVEVEYLSLSNPEHETRVIAPHTFVYTGLRWHLRAYCEKSSGFRDFVLSRFVGDSDIIGESEIRQDQDENWQKVVCVVLSPNPRLNQIQKNILKREYSMDGDYLTLHCRACLLQYLLHQLQVNTKPNSKQPLSHQLILVNAEELQEYLF